MWLPVSQQNLDYLSTTTTKIFQAILLPQLLGNQHFGFFLETNIQQQVPFRVTQLSSILGLYLLSSFCWGLYIVITITIIAHNWNKTYLTDCPLSTTARCRCRQYMARLSLLSFHSFNHELEVKQSKTLGHMFFSWTKLALLWVLSYHGFMCLAVCFYLSFDKTINDCVWSYKLRV